MATTQSKYGRRFDEEFKREVATLASAPGATDGQVGRALGVSRVAFYAGALKAARPRAAENARLWVKIAACFESSHRTYGSPRVTAVLRRGGEACSRHRVAAQIRGLPPDHARAGLARKAEAPLSAQNHRPPSSLPRRPQPASAQTRPADPPRRGLAGRPHLHRHRRGLVVSGRRAGPLPPRARPAGRWRHHVEETSDRNAYGSFSGRASLLGMRLLAWSRYQPADPAVGMLLDAPLRERQPGGSWPTTQGNAWGLLAVAGYVEAVERNVGNTAKGEIVLAGKRSDFTLTGGVAGWTKEFPLSGGPTALSVRNPNAHPLFLQVKLSARSAGGAPAPTDAGFQVARRYDRLTDDGRLRTQ